MQCTMITKEQYLEALNIVSEYTKTQIAIEEAISKDGVTISPLTKLHETNISNRLWNTLLSQVATRDTNLVELSQLKEYQFLQLRNFGKKSLDELRDLLTSAGLNFKPEYE